MTLRRLRSWLASRLLDLVEWVEPPYDPLELNTTGCPHRGCGPQRIDWSEVRSGDMLVFGPHTHPVAGPGEYNPEAPL